MTLRSSLLETTMGLIVLKLKDNNKQDFLFQTSTNVPEMTMAVMQIPNLFATILLVPTPVLVLLDSPGTNQTVKV